MADATDRNVAEKTRKTSDALGMTGMFGSEISYRLLSFPLLVSVICNSPLYLTAGKEDGRALQHLSIGKTSLDRLIPTLKNANIRSKDPYNSFFFLK